MNKWDKMGIKLADKITSDMVVDIRTADCPHLSYLDRLDGLLCGLCPIPSPGGIPPWAPPEDDSGEWLAYEGWAEWVDAHGSLMHKMQLIGYRMECAAKVFVETITPALENASKSLMKFARALAERPPT